MPAHQTILEHWLVRLFQDYPGQTVDLVDPDQFRNPVSFLFRENLAVVVRQLLGKNDVAVTTRAVQNVVRIRAVQDLTPSQATAFVSELKPIVKEVLPEADLPNLYGRIDQLSLIASREYERCREQLEQIRVSERQRATGALALAHGGRSR